MANPGRLEVQLGHDLGHGGGPMNYNSNIISPYTEVMMATNGGLDSNMTTTNLSSPLEDDSGPENDLYQIEPGLVALLSILYGSISAVTVLGNALVIVVVAKNRSMHTVTNFYIANLSFADVLIGVFSIPFQFQAALLQRWNLPHFLCPVAPFVKELTVNVSILTLAVIAVDRFYAVIYPLKPKCTKTMAKVLQASVWTFSFISALPAAIVFRVSQDNPPQCLSNFPEFQSMPHLDLARAYRLYIVILQYFLPLIVICYAYFRIIHRVWLSKAPGTAVDKRDQIMHKNKRKVIKMLIIVVALFAFCWMPLQTYNLLSHTVPEINDYRFINIIWFCSNWLAMSNSCYNPFIYGFLSEKYKQSFRLLCSHCKGRQTVHDPYGDLYEDTVRKSSTSHDDTRHNMCNGKAVKVSVRLRGYDLSAATDI